MIKFKSNQTELKLNSILNCIIQSNEQLNKNFSYDDSDINALSSVFNIPESDIKKIYNNFFTLINK
tara:strand:+ start:367 stop:564 length:198 start_codon:yes stop_codon:yes gene_type:complete